MNSFWDSILFDLYFAGTTALFSLGAFQKKGRTTHQYGVGGAGTLKIVDNPQFPGHEFFQPGKVFPVQIRHGSVRAEDDASMDLRSASIRFAEPGEESPLDILMNTGPRTFRHLAEFWNFTLASTGNQERKDPNVPVGTEAYCLKEPIFREILAEGMRRAPDTFTQMYYHSKLVNYFKAKDGILRYVKYRLIPEDRGAETGLPTPEQREKPWDKQRLPNETRPKDYLRKEYVERLSGKAAVYHLQLRLHEDMEGDKHEIFTQESQWSEETSPWLDLATVTIDRALSFEETEKLSFDIGRQPSSLGAVPGYTAHDPNSINATRLRVYSIAKAMRFLAYKKSGEFQDRSSDRESAA